MRHPIELADELRDGLRRDLEAVRAILFGEPGHGSPVGVIDNQPFRRPLWPSKKGFRVFRKIEGQWVHINP